MIYALKMSVGVHEILTSYHNFKYPTLTLNSSYAFLKILRVIIFYYNLCIIIYLFAQLENKDLKTTLSSISMN